jgi:two-component system copper resistance phosphate regulon response regulator CusR
MRVLVVEDEAKTAEYLQQGLTESGYIVDRASNGGRLQELSATRLLN